MNSAVDAPPDWSEIQQEICRVSTDLGMETHWNWPSHMEFLQDGKFTISDVWLALGWLFHMPGDGIIWAFYQIGWIAQFFEIGCDAYGGIFSGVISFFLWLAVLAMLAAASEG